MATVGVKGLTFMTTAVHHLWWDDR